MTDGAQTSPGNPYVPANELKKRGFEIYSVGAGDAKSHFYELERLKNKDLFFVHTAFEIPKLVTKVAQALCPRKYKVIGGFS